MAQNIDTQYMLKVAQQTIEGRIKADSRKTGIYSERVEFINSYLCWCDENRMHVKNLDEIVEIRSMYIDMVNKQLGEK